jgi:hypothetical protein
MKYRQFVFAALLAGICAIFSTSAAQAYQQNYTCQGGPQECSPGQDYEPIVWDHNCVLFYLDRGGSSDFRALNDAAEKSSEPGKSGPSKTLEKIVLRAFDAWSEPSCGGVSLVYGGLVDAEDEIPGQSRNVVSFQQEGWSENSMTVFATTTVSYNPNTGVIHDADITVNDEFYKFAADPVPGSGEADLQNTLTHEVGHFLGISHSEVSEATMYGSAGLEETKKRTLHEDDVAVLCRYYPADEADSVCGGTEPSNPTDEGPLLPDDSKNADGDEPGGDEPGDDEPGGGWTGDPTYGDEQNDVASLGCGVTGAGRSATLALWMPIFGLLALGLSRFRNRKRSF